MSNAKSPIFNWPENPDGEPLKLVTTSYQETIPTAPYANVQLFSSVTEFTDVPAETIDNNQAIIEKGLSRQRAEIEAELDKDD